MRNGVIASCSLTLALLAAPLAAWAGVNPDFDDDAKPILRSQPGLLQYVHTRFEVKDTGQAKYPGDDDRRPAPPYIFHARPRGSHGPFSLLLLIQPGPPGHVLDVVDGTRMRGPSSGGPESPQPSAPPEVAQRPEPPPTYQSPSLSQGDVKPLPPAGSSNATPSPAPAQEPAPSSPSEPTADTPSGPIVPSSSTGSSSSQPSLSPPPDPAPASQ